jgi:hypothetical protein
LNRQELGETKILNIVQEKWSCFKDAGKPSCDPRKFLAFSHSMSKSKRQLKALQALN